MLRALGAAGEEVWIFDVQGAGFEGLVNIRGCFRLGFGEMVAHVGRGEAGDENRSICWNDINR